MKKPSIGLWALYLMLTLYGITLSWFVYVGPITTNKIIKALNRQQQRVVISLTTTPYRIDRIRETLDSLLNQSIPADQIYLNIPYVLQRDNISYAIPEWLQNYPGITIKRVEDFGPITKLLPTLEQEIDPNTIIITVDDDVWYPRHVVRDLVAYSLQHPQVAVTPIHIDYTLNAEKIFTKVKYKFKHGSKPSIVVGAAGVAYRRDFFKNDFKQFITTLPAQCRLADDLTISMYLKRNHIDIEQTIEKSFNPIVVPFTYKELSYRKAPDSLSFGNEEFSGNQMRYSACLQSLL